MLCCKVLLIHASVSDTTAITRMTVRLHLYEQFCSRCHFESHLRLLCKHVTYFVNCPADWPREEGSKMAQLALTAIWYQRYVKTVGLEMKLYRTVYICQQRSAVLVRSSCMILTQRLHSKQINISASGLHDSRKSNPTSPSDFPQD